MELEPTEWEMAKEVEVAGCRLNRSGQPRGIAVARVGVLGNCQGNENDVLDLSISQTPHPKGDRSQLATNNSGYRGGHSAVMD